MIALWIVASLIAVYVIVWGAESFAEHLRAAAVRLDVSAFALALLLAGAEPEELATVDSPEFGVGFAATLLHNCQLLIRNRVYREFVAIYRLDRIDS